ncbi:glycoside hydrolase family 5 protein [Roseateles sp.]|uniref:glycoside hydrolase family 5 protein n=1 Tax=Roseateles sp. TaxID=1971397 RepID=UPI0039ED2151
MPMGLAAMTWPVRALLLGLGAAALLGAAPAAAADIAFWDIPRHGGNSFNGKAPDEAYFHALRATGATWARLTFSKWKGAGRDFLIGDADAYRGIPTPDLALLRATMDAAQAAGIRVVLVPLSLPGNRWVQHNGDRQDDRLWRERQYWEQSAAFWRDLAAAVKDHPALAGYNLLNEPTPEKDAGLDEQAAPDVRKAWYARHRGMARDLPAFYAQVIAAIREVDTDTPVMVDGGWYAHAWSFSYWTPLKDGKVLYAFHMYEPWAITSAPQIERKPQLPYPGTKVRWGGQSLTFDRSALQRFLAEPFAWARANGVPANRLVAGELGCVRVWTDCGAYLADVLDTLNGRGAHWAFYSFREDVWEGMDYEIPPAFPAGRVYELRRQGQGDKVPLDSPLMDVIRRRMR